MRTFSPLFVHLEGIERLLLPLIFLLLGTLPLTHFSHKLFVRNGNTTSQRLAVRSSAGDEGKPIFIHNCLAFLILGLLFVLFLLIVVKLYSGAGVRTNDVEWGSNGVVLGKIVG